MSELIRFEDKYYILATSPLADQQVHVLKHGDTFAVYDRLGDIQPIGKNDQGIFHDGMRHLSRLELRIGDQRPLLLSSTVKETNDSMVADLTNPELRGDGAEIPQDMLHIFRSKFLWQSTAYESIGITNFGLEPARFRLSLLLDADFSDLFEVRGILRRQRGEKLESAFSPRGMTLAYRGLDGGVRRTLLEFSRAPLSMSAVEVAFAFDIMPHGSDTLYFMVSCQEDAATTVLDFGRALESFNRELEEFKSRTSQLSTSNQTFNHWIRRSQNDLNLLITRDEEGLYPYAGIPWYSTKFGRDGIITAMECLWINPTVARGVLSFLASTQAKSPNPVQDAEPGKILHESRGGEMALTGEIPFRRYYGTVDATPLFVVLAGQYFVRTGDRGFVESIWPNILAALEWMDTYGDADGDGFLEYQRKSDSGLANQGWKDSWDSVFHADGAFAKAPIALCEVQGYAYEAKRKASMLAAALGDARLADRLGREAARLREQFDQAFWCERIGTYALALDGEKRQCRVRTSNAGHCLFSGIALPERAERVAKSLLAPDMFSGWGVRTLSSRECRYNPMSYHNGSVWPHDNALIAMGLARYGNKEAASKILHALFDACRFFEGYRMPELFCGFNRRADEGPTRYPVACSPQAWAVASVFFLLQACLGLEIDHGRRAVNFSQPFLPRYLHRIKLKNLQVGDALVDLVFTAHDRTVGIDVPRKEGDIDIVVLK